MDMDIVIPFVNESHWSNNELRYCIKSIRKNVLEDCTIHLVGEPCNEVEVDNFIEVTYQQKNKSKDIAYKIYQYCNQTVNDKFILFNDDYFVNKSISLNSIKAYSEEDLKDTFKSCHESYKEFVESTIKFLKILNTTTINYDIHYPMLMETQKFIEMYERFYRGNNLYLVKSLYGNYYKIPHKIIKDPKIRQNHSIGNLKEMLKDVDIFSISDTTLVHNYGTPCSIKDYLKEQFD